MTFGPWLVTGAGNAGPLAVVDRFFQTICASCATVSAFASTTRLFAPEAGTWPTVQTSVPSGRIVPPSPVTMRVNVVPSTGGTVTVWPSIGAGRGLRTRSVNGY